MGVYSWWSYRFNARKNNAGWRIDYFLASEELMPRIERADIYPDGWEYIDPASRRKALTPEEA